MKNKVKSLAVGALTASALSVGGLAIPAYAYPPGTHMVVSTGTLTSHHPLVFPIMISQAKPGSKVKIAIYDQNGRRVSTLMGVIGADGTLTTTATIAGKASYSSNTLKIKVISMSQGTFEKATTSMVVEHRMVWTDDHHKGHHGGHSGHHKSRCHAKASGFGKHKKITLTAVRGKERVVVRGVTNGRGEFEADLDLPSAGTWTIVASSERKSSVSRYRVAEDGSGKQADSAPTDKKAKPKAIKPGAKPSQRKVSKATQRARSKAAATRAYGQPVAGARG